MVCGKAAINVNGYNYDTFPAIPTQYQKITLSYYNGVQRNFGDTVDRVNLN